MTSPLQSLFEFFKGKSVRFKNPAFSRDLGTLYLMRFLSEITKNSELLDIA